MMWLRRAMGMQDMEQPQPVRRQTTDIEARFRPPVSPIENNPVGWSSTYAPEVASNASPDFSPLASYGMMTPEQKLGRFFNVATGRAKLGYTNADLPQLTAAGNEGFDAAMGWAGMTTPTIRAFHGSPHTFDRFDLSKIGTGEGAQAYGHGLYFAGNEGVAKGYRDALTVRQNGAPQAVTDAYKKIASPNGYLRVGEQQYSDAGRFLRDVLAGHVDVSKLPPELAKAVNDARPGGSMYEVNLRTSPERLLDWDKPLAQQPGAVREALGKIGIAGAIPKPYNGMPLGNGGTLRVVEDPDFGPKMFMDLASGTSFRINESDLANLIGKQGSEMFGKTAYTSAAAKSGGDAAASQALRDVGIDGLQYLDAGSRAAGDGSRNYVMFRDDIIDVLKRYGLFGLGMVGASQAGPYGEANP